MLSVPRQYLSVALMLSYKLNFSCCADMDGFPRPSHIIYVITTDAAAQSEGYGRHLKWIGYPDCYKPTKFHGINFRSNRIYHEIYIPRKFPRIR